MNHTATLTHMLLHVATTLEQLLDQTLQEQLGIGMSQYRILTSFERAESLSQRDIADFLNVTEAGVSRQLKLLSEKGLIATKIDARNRRQHRCFITPKGAKLYDAAKVLSEKTTHKFLAGIPERQQKHCLDVLEAMHRDLCDADPLAACKTPYVKPH